MIALLVSCAVIAVNAETFTIRNNAACSSKTTYQVLSSKTKVKLNKSNYSYDTNGLNVESGALIHNASKKINLTNSNGVQIIIIQDLISGRAQTIEYFLADKVMCTMYPVNNYKFIEKQCFSLANMDLHSGIQRMCASNNAPKISQKEIQKGVTNGTITVSGTAMKPIYESKN